VGQRVLITGLSRHLGYRVAQRLEADDDVDYIAGVDLEEPEVDLEQTEFIRADIRNPLIPKVLESTQAGFFASCPTRSRRSSASAGSRRHSRWSSGLSGAAGRSTAPGRWPPVPAHGRSSISPGETSLRR
jgi:NAD(P)-dependent dehydrogenase (short-subunit alcohol dehydrogenase family)